MKTLTTTFFFLYFLYPSFAQTISPDNSHLNSGNVLPEVIVTGEIELQTLKEAAVSDRAEDYQRVEFKLYALKAEEEIAQNENSIILIKSELKKQRGKRAIRLWHQLTALEIENQQLKDNLWNYLHYGLGNWNEFKEEFNEDIRPLKDDLLRIKDDVALTQ
jgi:hypothetical protein